MGFRISDPVQREEYQQAVSRLNGEVEAFPIHPENVEYLPHPVLFTDNSQSSNVRAAAGSLIMDRLLAGSGRFIRGAIVDSIGPSFNEERPIHDVARYDMVFNDICYRIFRGLPSFKWTTHPYPWMNTIIANHLRNEATRPRQHEKRKVDGMYHPESIQEAEWMDEPAWPDRLAYGSELGQAISDSVRSLPDHQRAIAYHHLRGAPEKEVCELVGVERGTLISRKHRGLARMRRDLERFMD